MQHFKRFFISIAKNFFKPNFKLKYGGIIFNGNIGRTILVLYLLNLAIQTVWMTHSLDALIHPVIEENISFMPIGMTVIFLRKDLILAINIFLQLVVWIIQL